MNNRASGFTLIEILVTIVVAMAVLAAATSILMDFIKNSLAAQNMNELILSSESINNHLIQDIHWIDHAQYDPTTQTLTLTNTSTGVQIIYSLTASGNWVRDGENMNNAQVLVKTATVDLLSPPNQPELWRLTFQYEHKNHFAAKQVYESQVVISTRNHQFGGP